MSLEASEIRALCFDVDGTLRDTDDQLVENLVRILNPVKFIFPKNDPLPFARRVIMKLENPGNYLHGLADRLDLDDHLVRFSHRLSKLGIGGDPGPFSLIEGVKEMITLLERYFPMAVVSARGERTTYAFLDHFGLAPYFKAIVTAQTCRHTKPYPDPVLWAAKKMGTDPGACLMVGDTTVDIRAGKAAGAQTAGVLCGFGEQDELVLAGADLILEATPDLVHVLLDGR